MKTAERNATVLKRRLWSADQSNANYVFNIGELQNSIRAFKHVMPIAI
jgi:hypothetical protein